MPSWIQYLHLDPSHAILVVVAIPPLAFLWKLRRRIRAGETELKHVAWFWCAALCAIVAWICTPILTMTGSPLAWLPLGICLTACAVFAPAALRNWSKDPWEKARKKKLPRPGLPLDGGMLTFLIPLVLKIVPRRISREPKPPKLKWVKAGKLNMNAVRGIAISIGIAFIWFNLWFMVGGLMQFGWLGFWPGPACLIAIIVFWNRLYTEKFLVEETDDGKAPDIGLQLPGVNAPFLPKLAQPSFSPKPTRTETQPVRFGKKA